MSRHPTILWTPQGSVRQALPLPPEIKLCLQVNGEHLLSLAASPVHLEALVLGFLYYSGIIRRRDEIAAFHWARENTCADVWLTHQVASLDAERFLTSGCGQGQVLGEMFHPEEPLTVPWQISPVALNVMMGRLQTRASLYRQTKGLHASALFTPQGELLISAEDIGRHNTLDKLMGHCLMEACDPAGNVLCTTGRVSSEMISKAARMRVPVVASLTAFTSLAVTLSEQWGITGVGYVRRRGMRIYTHPQRLIDNQSLDKEGGSPTPDR